MKVFETIKKELRSFAKKSEVAISQKNRVLFPGDESKKGPISQFLSIGAKFRFATKSENSWPIFGKYSISPINLRDVTSSRCSSQLPLILIKFIIYSLTAKVALTLESCSPQDHHSIVRIPFADHECC